MAKFMLTEPHVNHRYQGGVIPTGTTLDIDLKERPQDVSSDMVPQDREAALHMAQRQKDQKNPFWTKEKVDKIFPEAKKAEKPEEKK